MLNTFSELNEPKKALSSSKESNHSNQVGNWENHGGIRGLLVVVTTCVQYVSLFFISV